MTIEEIKALSEDEIQTRKSEIKVILDNVINGEDLTTNVDDLEVERKALDERLSEIRSENEAKKNDIQAVIDGEGIAVREDLNPKQEATKMSDVKEIRNSAAYIDAFAEALKTGDFTECRSILTENATDGTVAVPTFIEEKIVTAWEKSEIFQRVGKVSYKGNLKVGFEISGTAAVVHVEGTDAPSEEVLTLGAIEIVPQFIKKWITVSDEVMSLRGQAFLDYIYDEIAYKIVKKAEDLVIAAIIAAVGASSATVAGQATISGDVSKATILNAIAATSDEARDLVVIMNKSTWAAFKALETVNTGDPFNGLPVLFNNTLDSYSEASADEEYAIVGDLGFGARINLPDGNEVKFVFDDKSLAESDLVKIVGKLYAGIGIVAPNAFCVITKPDSEG